MSDGLRWMTAPMLVAALAAGLAGCKEKDEGKEGEVELPPAKAEPVPADERAAARREVARVWADPDVAARARALAGADDPESFYRDLAVLTRHPHRLAGYGASTSATVAGRRVKVFEDVPGSLAAGQYVARRLKAMGVELVLSQDFPVAQPVVTECALTVDGTTYGEGFYAMRPNHLQAPCTPEEGLTADRLVYGGTGELSEYRDSPRGAFVLLEFTAGERWKTAFALGARAVIFVGSGEVAPDTQHHLNLPANLPRFYVTSALAEKLDLAGMKASPTGSRVASAVIRAASRWKVLEGRNVIGVIRGTGAKFPTEKNADPTPEAILLAARLDSLSEVPLLSPGARQAANGAALLSLAERLQRAPPRRDVILAFLDGDTVGHAGARALYGSLYRNRAKPKAAGSLESRMRMFVRERRTTRNILDVLALGNIFTERAEAMPAHDSAVGRMRTEAKGMHGERRDELQLLRSRQWNRKQDFKELLAAVNLERRERGLPALKKDSPIPPERTRLAELRAMIDRMQEEIDRGEAQVLSWSGLRRALEDKNYPDPSRIEGGGRKAEEERAEAEAVLDRYHRVRRRLQDLSRERLAEMDRAFAHAQQGRVLIDAFGSKRDRIILHLVLNLGDASSRWAFIHGDDSQLVHRSKDTLGRYAKMLQAIRETSEAVRQAEAGSLAGFEARSIDGLHNTRMFAPGLFAHSGAVAGTFGVANLSLMTPMDRRDRDGQPCDVLAPPGGSDGFSVRPMVRALPEIHRLIAALGDAPSMNVDAGINAQPQYTEVTYKGGASDGAKAMMFSGASPMPDRPARDGFAAAMRCTTRTWEGARVDLVPAAYRPLLISRVNADGRFELPPLSRSYFSGTGVSCVLVAAKFDARGLIEYVTGEQKVKFQLPLTKVDCQLFRSTCVTAVGLGYDRGATATRALRAASTAPLNAKYSLVCEGGNTLTVYCRKSQEKLKVFNADGTVMLGNTRERPIRGEGIRIDPYEHPPTIDVTARDLQVLNQARLGVLSRNRILERSLERLDVESREVRERADRFASRLIAAMRPAAATRPSVVPAVRPSALELADYLRGDLLAPTLEAATPRQVVEELLSLMERRGGLGNPARARQAARDAEVRMPAGPAGDVACLYARTDAVDDLLVAVGLRRDPVALGPPGSAPARIVVLALAPGDRPGRQEALVAALAGALDAEGRRSLLAARTPAQMYGALTGREAPERVAARAGTTAASAAISRRAYQPLLAVFNDLIFAVVLLLLLSIPFAYSIERLLVGTPHIYRQIGWFVLFFLVTFAVLYVVNPAFRIAATPIVIFLAFGIILLSTIVIVIMTRKLQAEVRRMQGLSTTVHSSDVSRLGTMMAAVHMGISTMRRRPVRTVLTAVTVVLLTFTILTFASFTSAWGIRRTSIGPTSGAPRLLVRHPFWAGVREEIVDTLSGFLAGRATVVPRYWVSLSAQDVQNYKQANRVKEYMLGDAKGERIVPIAAMLGVDARDAGRMGKLADVLGGNIEGLRGNGVYLTPALVGKWGLRAEVGDTVHVDGVPCVLAGTIDVQKITRYKLLEGSPVTPANYEASGGGAGQAAAGATTSLQDLPETESARFEHYSPDRIAIIPASLARRLGGRVATITVYPEPDANADRIADQVATVTGLPTYQGARGGVKRLFFTSLTEASGWRDLIIPVVLGGLIIFATMLGSVSDREKEIYAFSALGLAPPHVAGLFFAEAAVYAVVGGMGGYLLGQVVARSLSFVSETFGVLTVPTMNYSSTNAIATVVVVMLTVMVSTIYPALKASRSANPGIQRSWRIGRPAGDLYDIVFPFTVSAYDITGVVSFLEEHFRNYSDSTLGVFATAHSHVFRQSDDLLGLRARVSLAPFDLGVSQDFALMAQPSEIEGIEEIRVLLRRRSGTRGDWQRGNRVFVHELRKQLLIWRSLSPEVMEQYRQRTLQAWASLPVEDIRPERFGEAS